MGASVQLEGGCYVANRRTTARVEGIRKFLATHPWVDSVDLRIFLSGFDAGEEYYRAVFRPEPDSQELRSVPVKTCPEVRP